MAETTENSPENEDSDIFNELKTKKVSKKTKDTPIKVVSGEEENNNSPSSQDKKPKMKETIKKVILAKAIKAAELDLESIPSFEKEHGTTESDASEKVKVESNGKVEKKSKILPELGFLETSEKDGVFIGRKTSVFEEYGMEGALHIGRIRENDFSEKDVYLDGLNPHAVFVCGSRGSGKSYFLGVLAEELALKNKNVGIVVIDPVGVFWSMRFPNREEKELESLAKWGLLPQGLDHIRVFIPEGLKEIAPKETFDATFSIQPSLLTPEDWCLTFGIDRFSPSGLLMEKSLQKIRDGYKTKEGKNCQGSKGKVFFGRNNSLFRKRH